MSIRRSVYRHIILKLQNIVKRITLHIRRESHYKGTLIIINQGKFCGLNDYQVLWSLIIVLRGEVLRP